MSAILLPVVLSIIHLFTQTTADDALFRFAINGFRVSNAMQNITLSGNASFIGGFGNLALTDMGPDKVGHGFYRDPIRFKSKDGKAISFSTTFIFIIACPPNPSLCGHGFTFALSPTASLNSSASADYLGLFNSSNDGNFSNHIVAVEFDTNQNPKFGESNDNHVGIDINSVRSNFSNILSYREGNTVFNISLKQPGLKQAWIEYDGPRKKMDVYVGYGLAPRPQDPVLSANIDLALFITDETYIGFAAATGRKFMAAHQVSGWSFALNGTAEALKAVAPDAPKGRGGDGNSRLVLVVVLVGGGTLLLVLIPGLIFLYVRRKQKFAEILEDWEAEYGPHSRFSYKVLYRATGGFKEANFLGAGGFGKVYKGVLPSCGTQVAVKKVAHDSPQGVKEFVAEIVSLRQLRHRNLVQLLGYCRRQGELLLVYEYMSNGSMDAYLFKSSRDESEKPMKTLNWEQRFDIVKGVASAILYLHEGWDQLVVHRDIKAGNVLLDNDYNGKLGDFGLARLYERGTNPRTTHVVGTLGYIAPELSMTGKATTSTDVYAYGAFLLEVACGRRPMEVEVLDSRNELVLTDWVLRKWKKDEILNVVDKKLEGKYVAEQMLIVLKLGLLCSQLDPSLRPSMRQAMQVLEGDASLPVVSPESLHVLCVDAKQQHVGFSDISMSFPSTTTTSSYTVQHRDEPLSPDMALSYLPQVDSSAQPR